MTRGLARKVTASNKLSMLFVKLYTLIIYYLIKQNLYAKPNTKGHDQISLIKQTLLGQSHKLIIIYHI